MLVLSVTECPAALRGDLSRWLLEVDTGVYVGQVSQRVREELWKRIVEHLKTGRAILVYSAQNEQRLDFRIHNVTWEPIDFDGLKLILRPSENRLRKRHQRSQPLQPGYSHAARMRMAKKAMKTRGSGGLPEHYVVLDLETTGLNVQKHQIVELGAIKIEQGREVAHYQALVRPTGNVSPAIQALTGLDEQTLKAHGQALEDVLPDFVSFLEDLPLVSHNIAFDMDFLLYACARMGVPMPSNRRIDTLSLARRYVQNAPEHKLTSLMAHFNLPYHNPHRSLDDCRATFQLLNKLIEIRESML